MGEISDDDFAELEADLLARIREIKERREGGSGPIAFGGEAMETTGDSRFQVEASVSGDFHDPADAPHTTIVEHDPGEGAIIHTDSDREIKVMDIASGEATVAAKPRRSSRASSERRRSRTK
jgi:hypothetical protein